jgi:hypothetical protein
MQALQRRLRPRNANIKAKGFRSAGVRSARAGHSHGSGIGQTIGLSDLADLVRVDIWVIVCSVAERNQRGEIWQWLTAPRVDADWLAVGITRALHETGTSRVPIRRHEEAGGRRSVKRP